MSYLDIGQLARTTGQSEDDLAYKLAISGIPVANGQIKLPEGLPIMDLLTRRPRIHNVVANFEQDELDKMERESPLSDSAAKALELARRVARDMAHPRVVGAHVLLGLTLVEDAELAKLPELANVSRRGLMEAVGDLEKLAGEWLYFKDRRSTLPVILGLVRKSAKGGRVGAADLLAAVLSDPMTVDVLDQAGADAGKLKNELRSGVLIPSVVG